MVFGCGGCPLLDVVEADENCYEASEDGWTSANIERNYRVLFGGNPYWERICKLADKQRAKGMETYGQGLESNPAAIRERIKHLQEELIDGLMYCEWINDKIEELMNQKGIKA